MRKITLFFLVAATAMFTACNDTKEPQVLSGHTEMATTPISKSVVAKPYTVRIGESINAIISTHNENVGGGYSIDMFYADNPHIHARPIKEVKRCDTLAYHSRFIYSGDVVYLRQPSRIDTVCGPGESVLWKKPHEGARIKQVLEPCGNGHLVSYQNIQCPDGCLGITPAPNPKIGDGNPDNRSGGWWGNFPSWLPWVLLALLMCVGFFILYRRIGSQAEETHTRVSDAHTETRAAMSTEHKSTRAIVSEEAKQTRGSVHTGLTVIEKAIKEQGDADRKLIEKQIELTQQSHKEIVEKLFSLMETSGRKKPKDQK